VCCDVKYYYHGKVEGNRLSMAAGVFSSVPQTTSFLYPSDLPCDAESPHTAFSALSGKLEVYIMRSSVTFVAFAVVVV
jgi:hypothetical protein